MFGRPILLCAGLLAAAIAAAWLRAEPALVPAPMPQLAVGQFYTVESSAAGGSFDLPLDAGSRYELIVSSLGDANRTRHVTLAAIPRARAESCPVVRPVAELARVRTNASCLNSGEFSDSEKVCQHQREAPARESVGTSSLALRVGIPQRRFFLHVTADALEDERGYVPVQGRLAGEGTCVRVYLDHEMRESDLAAGLIGEVIRLLDEEIIPRSREFLGEHADVDHDGKLAVLVTPWLGKLCGGRTSLKGFVRANDFQDNIAAPFGNHADVLYLNSSVETGPALKTLLAHEYTHAVCFSRRLANAAHAPLPPEEDWLNEAIAHVAENLHGVDSNLDWSNLDRRIAAFLGSPQTSPLAVRDYYRAGLWRDPGCRGATYLFLRYCVDQFGERLLRDLIDSPAVGRRNLERATGVMFPELFRRWTIALAQDDIASVRLHEKIGDCELAGLARRDWRPEAGPCEIDLRGTTTSRVVLQHSGNEQVVRIVVHGEPAAQLQVTLVRHAQ
ncbi:MAG TPA: hypothetical protein VGH74_06370 [Planctomycetaceae bacterium]